MGIEGREEGGVSEKLCLYCKHFVWQQFENEPAQYDSGYDTLHGGLHCGAGHFQKQNPRDEEELRAVFLTAERCKDYERPSPVSSPLPSVPANSRSPTES